MSRQRSHLSQPILYTLELNVREIQTKTNAGNGNAGNFPKALVRIVQMRRITLPTFASRTRKKMGLPNGWQWCTFHTKGCHYEHLCSHTHTHARAHTHTRTQIHTLTLTLTRAHTHTHTLSLTHTHTHTHAAGSHTPPQYFSSQKRFRSRFVDYGSGRDRGHPLTH